MFVADDLGAWLIALLADFGRKRLITVVLGSEQERALRQAAGAAITATAQELSPAGGEGVEQITMVINEVFHGTPAVPAPTGRKTLLEMLQAEIAQRLTALDDPGLTGTGQSSAELLGVPGEVLAQALTAHLLGGIVLAGSRGGALAPLASQLNHDLTHLQGERVTGLLARLVSGLDRVLAGRDVASRPVRLEQRPVFLAGREELLAELATRLSGDASRASPRVVALCGLSGAGKTSVAAEYAHRQRG